MADDDKKNKPESTSDFPQGMLNEHAKGGLQIAVGHKDGRVFLNFAVPITWVAMLPEEARSLARHIVEHANKLELENMPVQGLPS